MEPKREGWEPQKFELKRGNLTVLNETLEINYIELLWNRPNKHHIDCVHNKRAPHKGPIRRLGTSSRGMALGTVCTDI